MPEVEYSDQVYDRQVLLNETWGSYSARRGYPADLQQQEHVKWVTETWEEYEQRVPRRTAALEDYFDGEREKKRQADENAAKRQQTCDDTIARMMKREHNYRDSKLGVIHTLYVDFEEELRKKHERQRADMEAEELAARAQRKKEEQDARDALFQLAEESRARVQAILDEQRRIREAEEARFKEEQRRKAEELRKAEEEKKRIADEAERKRREEEEEAKRAERRRKEEERRAKAKAEREARAGGRGRGAGGAQGKDDQRAASRQARWNRMGIETNEYLEKLQPRADAVKTNEELQELYNSIAQELGGKILFHSAVYFGVVQQEGDASTGLKYVHASANCSEKLRSGAATLNRADGNADGITPMTLESCIDKKKCTGIVRNAQNSLINIGDWKELGTGDYVAAPITVTSGGSQNTVAIVACDTMSGNTADDAATLTGGAAEEHCYLKADGQNEIPYVAMPEVQGLFIEKLAEILSSAASRLNGDGTSSEIVAAEESSKAGEAPVAKDADEAKQSDIPAFSVPADIANIPALFNHLTGFLHRNVTPPGADQRLNAYISRFYKPDGKECTIVSHNGVALNDPHRHNADVPTHLLGASLDGAKKSSLTFSGFEGANNHLTHVYVGDVTQDERCTLYLANATKSAECLLLVPLRDVKTRTVAMVGVSVPAPPGLSEDMIKAIVEMILQLQAKLHQLLLKQYIGQLCSQAAEWLELTTGTSSVYISLKDGAIDGSVPEVERDHLTYVAGTSQQQWMVGKSLRKDSGMGISHAVLAAPDACEMTPINIASVAGFKHAASGATVHRWNDATKDADGALLLCPIAGGDETFGLIYADTLGTASGKKAKTAFTKSDEQLFKTTAQLLGGILRDYLRGRPATPADEELSKRILSIEELVGTEHIEFLKRIWIKVSTDIKNITKDQLLEMAKYNTPPPIIPVTVSATFIVLGTKPKTVEKWEDSRKKIKFPLLEKIVNFDPTSTKVKKAFFLRAKKLTKGYTADDVFTRGSYPASCFFTWTFVTILLRKSADALRKKVKNGEIDKLGVTTETDSMATDETLDDADGAEVDDAEGEDLPDAEEDAGAEEAPQE